MALPASTKIIECEQVEDIGSRYALTTLLGKGSYGEAYLAFRVTDHAKVVVKRVDMPRREDGVAMLLNELRALRAMTASPHRGVLTTLGAYACLDGSVYIATPFVTIGEPETLQSMLLGACHRNGRRSLYDDAFCAARGAAVPHGDAAAVQRVVEAFCAEHRIAVPELTTTTDLVSLIGSYRGSSLPVDMRRSIEHDIFAALAHVHSVGYAHRDLKADNVVVAKRVVFHPVFDEAGIVVDVREEVLTRAVLIDFGFALPLPPAGAPAAEVPVRMTPAYATPELVDARLHRQATLPMTRQQLVAADLWAAGVTMLCMARGNYPFTPPNDAAAMRQHHKCGTASWVATVDRHATLPLTAAEREIIDRTLLAPGNSSASECAQLLQ